MASKDTASTDVETADAASVAAAVEQTAPAPAVSGDVVSYRVLKKGDGMIQTGQHNAATLEFETYKRGDVVSGVARSIALELEDRGFAEIVDE